MVDFKAIKKSMAATNWSPRAVVAEFIAMTFFVFIGCGTAVAFSTVTRDNFAESSAASVTGQVQDLYPFLTAIANDLKINSSFGICTALAFGIGILVNVYAISHISGGHLNPAVTLTLFLSGNVGCVQAIGNMIAQFVGATLGAGLLYGMIPNADTSSLGANSPSAGVSSGNAVLGEIVMTCLLCYTVLMTAVDSENRHNVANLAPLAIGMAVATAHFVLIPIDGCSINPARSFGPALVSGDWADGRFWIFIVGPFVGAIFAVPIYWILSTQWESKTAQAEIGVERTGGMSDDDDVDSPKV